MATKQATPPTPSEESPSIPEATSTLSQEEANAIFDELLFSGIYTEVVPLTAKVSVEFKTKTAKEVQEISKNLQALNPTTDMQAQGYLELLHLAYSIASFKGTSLMDRAAYPERYEFISKFPAPVIVALQKKLDAFNDKINKALEVVPEGF